VAAPPLLLLPQKVFVVGMFKTGTTSLTSALRKLGGNCGGGTTSGLTTCGFNPRMLPLDTDWLEPDLLDRLQKSPFYDDVLRLSDDVKTTLFADAPFLFLYRELDRLHPGSKFILSLRHGGVESYLGSEKRLWDQLGIVTRVARELNTTEELA